MKVIAIVVTYQPDLVKVKELIHSLKKQDVITVIVDNSDLYGFEMPEFESVIIKNGCNYGIAKAQNIGITFALDNNADFICFFDQDSIIPSNFTDGMITNRDPSVHAVYCPLVVDELSGDELPAFRLSHFGFPDKVYSNGLNNEFRVDLAISSGTVVTANTFLLVGKMNEDLFIDLVDFEWCFKCLKFDVPITCVAVVIMSHSIGLKKSSVRFGGVLHNPFRHYFKQRNPFYMLSYSYIPKAYSIRLVLVSLVQSSIVILNSDERFNYFKSTFKAIFDGVKYLFLNNNKTR